MMVPSTLYKLQLRFSNILNTLVSCLMRQVNIAQSTPPIYLAIICFSCSFYLLNLLSLRLLPSTFPLTFSFSSSSLPHSFMCCLEENRQLCQDSHKQERRIRIPHSGIVMLTSVVYQYSSEPFSIKHFLCLFCACSCKSCQCKVMHRHLYCPENQVPQACEGAS